MGWCLTLPQSLFIVCQEVDGRSNGGLMVGLIGVLDGRSNRGLDERKK